MIRALTKILLAPACLLFAMVNGAPAMAANKTPLVTGNGFGFAVYSNEKHCVNGFYAHPYKFARSIKDKPLEEGEETANLIESARWHRREGSPEPAGNLNEKAANYQLQPQAMYEQQSQIIEIKGKSSTERIYMPFGLKENVLIFQNQPDHDCGYELQIQWKSAKAPKYSIAASSIVIPFQDRSEIALVIPLGEHDGIVQINGTTFSGAKGWAIICLDDIAKAPEALAHLKAWHNGLSCDKLVARELSEIERWRVKPKVTFQSENERNLWRQSEIMLRMGQSRESNIDSGALQRYSNGLIIASLPDGAWWVPWVRDMVYATFAFMLSGHNDEAESALMGFFNARPVGKMAKAVGGQYQISVVRYFGDGEEEPFFTMEGATNIEFDNWGLVLWTLDKFCSLNPESKILDRQTYRGTVYESARDYIVRPLLNNLEPFGSGLIVKKDTSIWEEKQKDEKHFAYTTAAAIMGLEYFLPIAKAKGDKQLCSEIESKTELLRLGFGHAFSSSDRLRGALEDGIKNEVDGAMLSAITMGIVRDKTTIDNTIKAMDALKMPSGGFRRVHSIVEDPKIFEYWYERQEFLFIDFSVASVYLRAGHPELANALIEPVVAKAARDNFILPEMYVSEVNDRFTGAIGEPTGATPMVGYGAGAFMSYLIDREQLAGAANSSASAMKSHIK